MIRNYSPNIQWGKQHIEVTLMQWDYSAKIVVSVGGNTHGMSVMDCAMGQVYDRLHQDDGPAKVKLKKRSGSALWCTDDDERGEDWVRDMVVSVKIEGWTPPTLNEVRKMNGAKPVADGDQPWQPL